MGWFEARGAERRHRYRTRVQRRRDAVARRWRRELTHVLLEALMPGHCPGCGEMVGGLCARCDAGLVRRLVGEPCPRCGDPVGPTGRCLGDHGRLRNLAFHVAPFRFVGSGGGLVRRLKLSGEVAAGVFLVRAMVEGWRLMAPRSFADAVLVPVPMHRAKRRRRGFDQAAWLARELGERVALPVLHVLRRERATLPQGDVRVLSRAENVRGAFVVHDAAEVRRRRCVLVDDVFTSGATMRECARLLLEAGAAQVAAWTACRS
jgi:competence protein ComFC